MTEMHFGADDGGVQSGPNVEVRIESSTNAEVATDSPAFSRHNRGLTPTCWRPLSRLPPGK